ncbi:MAG: 2-oxoglutarate dehydrogenase complex dihydrolipoyllysine-residue succinyltransferase [Desulfobacterales bacterium]|nr:2-oxoglutarate dehydrogenase complex dihydrolipoyllysine-residue succinyltransferase [Desulfobacterales bacterium]
MLVEIKVPSVGESVTEAVLAQWFKKDGDQIKKGEALFVIETDKVTLEVEAEADGVLKISVGEGETVSIGAVVGTIDTVATTAEAAPTEKAAKEEEVEKETVEPKKAEAAEREKMAPPPQEKAASAPEEKAAKPVTEKKPIAADMNLSPAVRRIVKETGVDVGEVIGTGPAGRITKGDVLLYLEAREAQEASTKIAPLAANETTAAAVAEETSRKPMTPIRQRIAARLLEARQNTAMLTTFNDVDMSRVMETRSRYKDAFQKKYGVSLGFMSFFIKAAIEALKEFPEINAFIDGKEIVYHHYYHIGVAIGTGRGLVVPVIRHCEKLSLAMMEQAIVDYVTKIKENRLDLADLEGGTFTITNGGVFGSLLSTPILNTPQSAILGMHRIEKRPVVIEDQIVVRPMMYLALSYDHRIVDGREAVIYLRRIKEFLENPERMIVEI